MQTKAKLRFLRMSPKKVRLVVDVVRGMKVNDAITELEFLNKAASLPVLKLLKSAIANAENNLELKKDNLFIKEIRVDQGSTLKRWKPRAHGRATPIRKKTSHVNILLEEIEPTKQKKKKAKKEKAEKAVKVSSLDQIKQAPSSSTVAGKKDETSKNKEHEKEIDKEIKDVRMEGKHRHKQHQDKRGTKQKKGFINKIFNRKAG